MKEPVMLFFPIQFEALPAGMPYFFFFMSPWHLNYSESTLWNLLGKKKNRSYIHPCSTGDTSVFWTFVI